MRIIPRYIETQHEALSTETWPDTAIAARTLYDFMACINREYTAEDERLIEMAWWGGPGAGDSV